MSVEIWKDVVGYEGQYQVSNRGRVKSIGPTTRKLILKPHLNFDSRRNTGYLKVCLNHHGRARVFKVHTLVTEAFIGPRPHGHGVNHRDGNKLNNQAGNLEWMTHAENIRHAFALGLFKSRAGERNNQSKLIPSQVLCIRKLKRVEKQRDTARRYGVSQRLIWNIQNRVAWTHLTQSPVVEPALGYR